MQVFPQSYRAKSFTFFSLYTFIDRKIQRKVGINVDCRIAATRRLNASFYFARFFVVVVLASYFASYIIYFHLFIVAAAAAAAAATYNHIRIGRRFM